MDTIWVLFLSLLSLSVLLLASSSEDLPRWEGETDSVKSEEKEAEAGIRSVLRKSEPFTADPTKVIQLSWRPRAFLYKVFLTDEESDHLINLAKAKLEKSMVVDNNSGKSLSSEIRTSSGMFLGKGQDEIVRRIEDRIAAWTFLPRENAESIQVLRYQHGQKYEPHYDYFHDDLNKAMGGGRYATVLMYLATTIKGGETIFPNTEDNRIKDDSWSDCSKKGLAVKPHKGDALLFFSLHPNGTRDEYSLHEACPVIEGEKWSAPTWIHVRAYENSHKKNGCEDENENCALWAAYGECKKNAAYMVGTPEWPGYCRKSCKLC